MRRLALLAAALSILAVVLYGLSRTNQDDILRIGTIPSDRSLLLEADGVIPITLYFSRAETLFVRSELIRSASIRGDDAETAMVVRSIDRVEDSHEYHQGTYVPYRFGLSLGFVVQDGFAIEWRNAVLQIEYEDDAMLEIPIGTLSIRIGEVSSLSPLSLERLYGRKGDLCGIKHVLIGISNRTAEPIAIAQWDTGLTGHAIAVERLSLEHPAQALERLDNFGQPFGSQSLILSPNEIVYVVLRLSEEDQRPIRHFYLRAVWNGLQTSGSFLIDDFVYVTEEGGGCDGGFVEIVFRYPR
jgi:hypothetical protein